MTWMITAKLNGGRKRHERLFFGYSTINWGTLLIANELVTLSEKNPENSLFLLEEARLLKEAIRVGLQVLKGLLVNSLLMPLRNADAERQKCTVLPKEFAEQKLYIISLPTIWIGP